MPPFRTRVARYPEGAVDRHASNERGDGQRCRIVSPPSEGLIALHRRPPPRRSNALVSAVLILAVVFSVGLGGRIPIELASPRVLPTPASPHQPSPETVAGLARTTTPSRAAATEAVPTARSLPTESPATEPVRPACAGDCLVRLPDPEPGGQASLAERGLRIAYTSGGMTWAAASPALIGELRSGGVDVEVLAESDDTLRLYAVRLLDGMTDDGAVLAIGEIVDRTGNTIVIQASTLPPRIDDIVARGIWIEKFPPPVAGVSGTGARSLLQSADQMSGAVSQTSLSATIADLQSAGAMVGGADTRHYLAPGNVAAAEYVFRRMAELGLDVRYEDFVSDTGTIATNVVGELPGRDRGTIYVVTGHFDSLADTPEAPGADDNASGIAAMLEIARLLSAFDLPASVRFVALNAEEAALQGADAFGAQADAAQYAGGFNLDAIGAPGRDHQLLINADSATAWLQDALAEANDIQGIGQDLVMRQNPAIVADDTVLREHGIPIVLVTRAVVGENPIHHTAADILENLDLHGVAEATLLVAATLTLLLTEG